VLERLLIRRLAILRGLRRVSAGGQILFRAALLGAMAFAAIAPGTNFAA